MESVAGEPVRRYPITLVTAYFDLGDKAGRGRDSHWYYERMRYFVPFIRWPLVIFCDEESVGKIKQLRGEKPATYIVTTLKEFYSYKYKYYERFHCSSGLQRAGVHKDVACLWSEKCNFVRRAIRMNPYTSELFYWCDIGGFRGCDKRGGGVMRLSERIEWPNFRVCRRLPKDKAIFVRINQTGDNLNVHGGFFGGAPKPLLEWIGAFYRHVDHRVDKNLPLQEDEFHMSAVCEERPNLAHFISSDDVPWAKAWGKAGWRGAFKWYFLNGGRFPLLAAARGAVRAGALIATVKDWGLNRIRSSRRKV